ncbi:MAG: DUF896 domain-containing protein [Clostridia bacterium]|nr:DUF896 domain-containing protein [Clostridia bacterium]
MTKEQIDRINELGRKSRAPEGLTDAERAEQAELRLAYLAWFRASLRGQTADAPKKNNDTEEKKDRPS